MLRRSFFTLLCAISLASTAQARKRSKAPASSPKAAAALAEAKADWQALKHDPKHAKYRCYWLDVTHKFEAVSKHHPHTVEAAKALFDGAEVYEDLSHISWIQDDVDAAVASYKKLVRDFPHSSLADDAQLALARIYLNRKNDADGARAVLEDQLHRYPRGDMANQARAMIATLPAPSRAARKHRAPSAPRHAAVAAVKKARETSPSPAVKAPPAQSAEVAKVDPSAHAASGAPEADTRPLEPVTLGKGASKGKLAALSEMVKSSDDDLPLSAQMGLKVHRVVIDAGHGGHDSGALGPDGLKEKDVTLAVATKLAAKLRAQGLQVFMTRTTDRFVSLENRAAFANREHADLFISVHCNAARSHKLRGVETYSLNVSSNRYAVRLAARENASSERSIGDLQFMLADLATRANTEDSRHLASLVQHSVVAGLSSRYGHVRNLGTKEALFYVLLGTRMPAILVEGSFISNPVEEKRLGNGKFQDALAESIAAGVERFMAGRQALATADLR